MESSVGAPAAEADCLTARRVVLSYDRAGIRTVEQIDDQVTGFIILKQ
jgi:hypothetical protein